MKKLTSIEICAGAGGQALGLEAAGFDHLALVEIDKDACQTLRSNRPNWNVVEGDLRNFSAKQFKNVDLLAGGVPCPPFSKAGKQLGKEDERDMFPEAVRLVRECRPKAVMLENVRGLLDEIFIDYRKHIETQLRSLGYEPGWHLLNASDHGVSQLRPRVVFVAMHKDYAGMFRPPLRSGTLPKTVGELLFGLMDERGWKGAKRWKERANDIAPTLVGGSKRHGGPDLGPTRAKRAWAALSVDAHGIANAAPDPDFVGMPRLTVTMAAKIQGFDEKEWEIWGKKTTAYRQVGNAFPPPVAKAMGAEIAFAIMSKRKVFALR